MLLTHQFPRLSGRRYLLSFLAGGRTHVICYNHGYGDSTLCPSTGKRGRRKAGLTKAEKLRLRKKQETLFKVKINAVEVSFRSVKYIFYRDDDSICVCYSSLVESVTLMTLESPQAATG